MSRRVSFVVLLALVVVIGAYASSARRTTGPPLDPDSTAADGTRATVELLERFASSVTVSEGVPGDAVDTALVLYDRFDRDEADRLDAWVRRGGTLVVVDVASSLTPEVSGASQGARAVVCDLPALADVVTLDLGDGRTFVDDGRAGCRTDDGPVVLATSRGLGTVVAIGGAAPFTNRLIDDDDNAVLAVALLAPNPQTQVSILVPRLSVGAGDEGLIDLVGTPVWAALAQLAIAFALVVWWRAPRLGRPVPEQQPVAIESSELTRAVGHLYEGSGRPDHAAEVLRDKTRLDLSAPLGLRPDATVDELVAAIVAHTSLDDARVRAAVADPVPDDDTLVVVAQLLSRTHQEVTHGRHVSSQP